MSEKAKALLARVQEMRENVNALKELWKALFPTMDTPPDSQFQVWLNLYKDVDIIADGLDATLQFLSKANAEQGEEVPEKTIDDLIRYASGCMKWMKKKADGEVPPHLADKLAKLGKVKTRQEYAQQQEAHFEAETFNDEEDFTDAIEEAERQALEQAGL